MSSDSTETLSPRFARMSSRIRRWLVPGVLGVLALALALGLADARIQMGRQDVLIAELNVALSDLRNAAAALREDVGRLGEERQALLQRQEALQGEVGETTARLDQVQAERDRLQSERDRFQAERDRLRAERDRFQAERDRLQAERDALQAERETLRGRLALPTPAPPTGPDPARSAALARVLDLDDQIESEFNVFLGHLEAVLNSFNRGNLLAAQAGYTRANQSADRLKELFRLRNEAAKPLR